MKVGNLSNVQNFSALKNNKTDNTVANPNFKAQEKVEQPTKQMVNAQNVLAYNMSFKGNVQNDEISLIDKKLEESKAKFMEENKNNIPPYEERYREVLGNLRITSWGGKPPIVKAENIASDENRYLKHIWEHLPEVKELQTEKNIMKMNDKERELFYNAKKSLDERNLVYDELDLSNLALGCTKPEFGSTEKYPIYKWEKAFLEDIADGIFSGGGFVIGHGSAYKVNYPLRMGYEVNDIVRVAMDEGFKTVEPTKYPQTVYRAVCGNRQDGSIKYINQLLNAKNGDIITDKGYSYTSTDQNKIKSCNGSGDVDSPNITLIINIPEGARVSHHLCSAQSEVLLPRNSEFRVVEEAKVVTDEYGFKTTVIELEYVLPEE